MFDQSHLNNAGFNVIQQYDRGDKQIISVTDLISEGPIYGLVDAQASVYLNDDRAAPLNQGANPYNQTGALVQLTSGSTSATVTNSTASPIIASTTGDKYLIVRAVHTVYGTASNGSTSDINANTTALLTANNNFFNDILEPSVFRIFPFTLTLPCIIYSSACLLLQIPELEINLFSLINTLSIIRNYQSPRNIILNIPTVISVFIELWRVS